MGMDRRDFFKWFGVGVGAAPAVKAVVTMPDATPEQFPGYKQLNSAFMDVQDGLLYDRIRFEAGQQLPHRIEYFITPVGQRCPYSGVVKTLRHTNLWAPGALHAPNCFLAQRALFAVHPSALLAD